MGSRCKREVTDQCPSLVDREGITLNLGIESLPGEQAKSAATLHLKRTCMALQARALLSRLRVGGVHGRYMTPCAKIRRRSGGLSGFSARLEIVRSLFHDFFGVRGNNRRVLLPLRRMWGSYFPARVLYGASRYVEISASMR